MIIPGKGNIIDANVEAVINTVNELGVMGKGLALEFKSRYPANFKAYEDACQRGEVSVGKMFVTEHFDMFGPRWLINFPTKRDWRNGSRLEWIEAGLLDLQGVIADKSIRSIAVPPLGCGNGGLDWKVVRGIICESFSRSPCEVHLYEPMQA
jgi:Predicted phosphatase homologous to the C-terminal domain of histone macroH2A1